MDNVEKLRVMLQHWIDHNKGHGGEFAQWAEKLTNDSPEVAQLLHDAVQSLQKAQSYLEEALEKAGGNRSQAARDLGIERHVLLYRLKKYSIDK